MKRMVSKRTLRMVSILVFTSMSVPALAGHRDNGYDYARVVDVQPVVEVVQVPHEQQTCRDEVIRRRVPEYRSPGPAIFGSILGGVIGSQFGGGSGKTAATIAGATIGGAVASNARHRRYPPRYYAATEQRCYTQTRWSEEERVVAWDVSWKYHGKIYHSRMDEPPGDRIRVRVRVDPVYR